MRTSTASCASCATTVRTSATSTAMGFNSRLDDIHAGILSAKLKHIDDWNDLRRKWAARYTAGLKDVRNITLPYETPGCRHIFHLYVIETKRKPAQRDALLEISQRKRHRCQEPLLHRHSSAGRLSVGQAGAHRRPAAQCRAQRRRLHLSAHVPRIDRRGSRLRRSRKRWNGTRRMNRSNESYKVVVVGMGKRGMHHAAGFSRQEPRFEVAGICDIDPARLEAAAAKLGKPQNQDRRRGDRPKRSSPTFSASARCPTCARR